MADLETITEERGKLAKKLEEYRDKFHANGKKWTDDTERQAWEKVNTDYNAKLEEWRMANAEVEVDARLKEVRDIEERTRTPGKKPGTDDYSSRSSREGNDDIEKRELERRGNDRKQKLPDEERRGLALAGFCRAKMGHELRDEHLEAMKECRMQPWVDSLFLPHYRGHDLQIMKDEYARNSAGGGGGTQGTVNRGAIMATLESRALSGISAAPGGALVPDTFLRRIEINRIAWGGMLQACTTVTTADGGEMTLPTADDTANIGRRIGENAAVVTTGKDPTFGGVTWSAYGYTTDAVKVPFSLMEDSFMDLGAFLAEAFGMRNGRKMNLDFTTGADANGPAGYLTKAALGWTTTTGQTTSIIYDDVVKLRFSVDPAYRNGGSYMCHDQIAMAFRLIKDTQNRPLWTSGVQLGGPDTLDGYHLYINMDMASSIVASAKTLAYGDFRKYKARMVGQRRMYRLTELYRENDQDGFVMFERADGNLETASATNTPIKYMAQAAS